MPQYRSLLPVPTPAMDHRCICYGTCPVVSPPQLTQHLHTQHLHTPQLSLTIISAYSSPVVSAYNSPVVSAYSAPALTRSLAPYGASYGAYSPVVSAYSTAPVVSHASYSGLNAAYQW
ncbi:hypothetical protein JTB14_005262 [Gonioctena quinquepunctata]|nr:hypothetical protein JTB14_005262 [Gonioctena quinquepunctata]